MLGVDISEQQLALARQRVAAAGVNQAQLVLDDAATHHFTPETFDLGFSRFGVMFFADPVAAFRNIRAAMKRSGRLLLAVFRSGPEIGPVHARPRCRHGGHPCLAYRIVWQARAADRGLFAPASADTMPADRAVHL